MRDEQGQEMHKSTGNAIWFDQAVEEMGADVMRWLYCGQNPTNNLNFGFHIGQQVQRRVFSTWWNVYTFFVNYARLDGFDPTKPAVPYDQLQDIDRWLLSKLQTLIKTAHQAFTEYDVASVVNAADDFIERLSNWYVRRNRRRYWRPRSDSDTDKLAAYQTLYRVLVDLCKVLAPIAPFVTEQMYQNLVRSDDSDAPESVHHCDYPTFDEELYDQTLAAEMDTVVDVVSTALSMRESKQIRVRQPLSELQAFAHDDTTLNALKKYEAIILDELNIKKLTAQLVTEKRQTDFVITPNMKNLGPKFGAESKEIMAAIGALDPDARREMGNRYYQLKPYTLQANGKTWQLEAREDFTAAENLPENIVPGTAQNVDLYLNIEITEPLRREGLARDIVRHIQQLRKDSGLEIQDHITIGWDSDSSDIIAAIEEHADYIACETLAKQLTRSVNGDTKEVTLGKALVLRLAVTKA